MTARLLIATSVALWCAIFAARGLAVSPTRAASAAGWMSARTSGDHGLEPLTAQLPAGYVGSETCVTCHQDRDVQGTAHGRTIDARTPMAREGCESCHGPGQAHADAGGDPEKIASFREMRPHEASAACTACHNRSEHAMWDGSPHQLRNLTCTTCHSVHTPRSAEAQLVRATPMQVCADCHRDKVAKVDRSGHMPVREGKMTCATCHNPHGSANVRLLRAGFSSAEACTSCHADKRGPMLFEHAPVRESCATCHDPHGSPNERMLVQKQPFLCQRCHSHVRHPGTLYDNRVVRSSNRIFARSCVTCHSQVHGSNHPSGHFFLR